MVIKQEIHHLAKLSCGHVEIFVLSPIIGWEEWCSTCKDFYNVDDGVSVSLDTIKNKLKG